jgi:hypothetical protein
MPPSARRDRGNEILLQLPHDVYDLTQVRGRLATQPDLTESTNSTLDRHAGNYLRTCDGVGGIGADDGAQEGCRQGPLRG